MLEYIQHYDIMLISNFIDRMGKRSKVATLSPVIHSNTGEGHIGRDTRSRVIVFASVI